VDTGPERIPDDDLIEVGVHSDPHRDEGEQAQSDDGERSQTERTSVRNWPY
jgi:hypothetical protein